jgi:hypothetical protein
MRHLRLVQTASLQAQHRLAKIRRDARILARRRMRSGVGKRLPARFAIHVALESTA